MAGILIGICGTSFVLLVMNGVGFLEDPQPFLSALFFGSLISLGMYVAGIEYGKTHKGA